MSHIQMGNLLPALLLLTMSDFNAVFIRDNLYSTVFAIDCLDDDCLLALIVLHSPGRNQDFILPLRKHNGNTDCNEMK